MLSSRYLGTQSMRKTMKQVLKKRSNGTVLQKVTCFKSLLTEPPVLKLLCSTHRVFFFIHELKKQKTRETICV
jgi:hypothetical protein